MTTNTTTAPIPVDLSTGRSIPFRPAKSQKGDDIFGVINPTTGWVAHSNSRGVNVAADVVGDGLPTYVEVLGKRVELKTGTTGTGNPKRYAANVPVEVDGEPRAFSIRISRTQRGYNVAGSITRRGQLGGNDLVEGL
jgi:hypothetical protein